MNRLQKKSLVASTGFHLLLLLILLLRLLPGLSDAVGRHYFNLTEDAPHRVHTRIEPAS